MILRIGREDYQSQGSLSLEKKLNLIFFIIITFSEFLHLERNYCSAWVESRRAYHFIVSLSALGLVCLRLDRFVLSELASSNWSIAQGMISKKVSRLVFYSKDFD